MASRARERDRSRCPVSSEPAAARAANSPTECRRRRRLRALAHASPRGWRGSSRRAPAAAPRSRRAARAASRSRASRGRARSPRTRSCRRCEQRERPPRSRAPCPPRATPGRGSRTRLCSSALPFVHSTSADPHVRPAPIPVSSTSVPSFSRPSARASASASGMEPDEVFPYLSTFTMVFSVGSRA
jgi:hypothetical protein